MPILKLQQTVEGFELEVLVGLDQQDITALQAVSHAVPPMLRLRGLIDTGCTISAVSPVVIQHFGIGYYGSRSSTTASGLVRVNLCSVMLAIAGPTGVTGSQPLLFPTLLVSELTQPLPNIDVLVGQDVLKECLFFADGPRQEFFLTF